MNISTIITIVFSGAFLAFLQFLITFFITRKDNKEKEAKEEIKEAERASKDERFDLLEKEFHEGLDQREQTGKARYDEHKEAINNMAKQHQEQFEKLLDAIKDLKISDEKVSKILEEIVSGQQMLSSGVLGLTHFELMYITNIIIERKYITLTEKATIDSLYEPYTKLGGNGQVRKNYEYVMNFPIVSDEEAKKMDDEIIAKKANTFFGNKK